VDRSLEPAPEPTPEELAAFDDQIPTPRSPWWRWIAVILVVSLVMATPFAYALYRFFD
jgi:hypothetical protein